MDIAADILKEAQQLATELRESGKKMGEHLKEFAKLAGKVSTAMRNTRAEVLNQSEGRPLTEKIRPEARWRRPVRP